MEFTHNQNPNYGIVVTNTDNVNGLIDEDEQCNEPNCERDSEFFVRTGLWWTVICEDHFFETFGDHQIDVIPSDHQLEVTDE